MVRKASTYTLEEARQLVFEHAEQLLREYAETRGTAAVVLHGRWLDRLVWQERLARLQSLAALPFAAELLRSGRVTGQAILDEADRIAARIIGVYSLDPDRATGLRFKARQAAIARRNVERSELAEAKWKKILALDAELMRDARLKGELTPRRCSKTHRAKELVRIHKLSEPVNTIRQKLPELKPDN